MIPVTLTIAGKQKKKYLPYKWSQVTWSQFVAIHNSTKLEPTYDEETGEEIVQDLPDKSINVCLSIILEEPLEDIDAMPINQLIDIQAKANFLLNENTIFPTANPFTTRIAMQSFAKLEKARVAIKYAKDEEWKAGRGILKSYLSFTPLDTIDNILEHAKILFRNYPKPIREIKLWWITKKYYRYIKQGRKEKVLLTFDIEDKPVTEVISIVSYFYNQIVSFLHEFKELKENKLSQAESDAMIMDNGYNCFEGLELFSILEDLSNKNPTQYEAILQLEAITVFTTRLYRHRAAGYSERYNRLINPPTAK